MEHDIQVLKSKLESDARLNRQNLQGAAREKESLKKQLVLAHAEIEEREKELRAAALEIRKLNRRLAPTKGSPNNTRFYYQVSPWDWKSMCSIRAAD